MSGSVRDELGVDEDTYRWLEDWSQGRCWICRHPERVDGRSLAVDHDHRTGAVRGLLCTSCNRRLGGTVDPEWLWRAAAYLARASRAFGNWCKRCAVPTESRLLETDGKWSRYTHECQECGEREVMGYRTHGVPFAWETQGTPPAPRWEPLRPSDGAGFCLDLPTEPDWWFRSRRVSRTLRWGPEGLRGALVNALGKRACDWELSDAEPWSTALFVRRGEASLNRAERLGILYAFGADEMTSVYERVADQSRMWLTWDGATERRRVA